AWGITHVPSAFAGITMGALPILLVPLVWWFSPDEGIGPRRIAGLCIGFVGLALLMGPGAVESTGPMTTWGRIACFAAACCYAVGSIVTRRAPPMPPVAFGAGTLVAGSALLVPIALIFEGWPPAWPLGPMLAVLYAALLPTALAAVIRVRVITTAGSLFMSFVNYMVPVWAAIFGVVLLSEDLPPQLFTALGLILAGIAVAQSRQIGAMLRARG
ncbi:MAG: DMT family transporter, partial [Pseudomonadota bacterium]